ncbi:MAG: prepilin-type N-terminal cleavage/methylation domain-containing protein [Planctomycetota bacterium]|jgi:prepilin-type N-terminal cleavage/methylation domain-containing protein
MMIQTLQSPRPLRQTAVSLSTGRAGFTLIEMLAVLLIIGILFSFLVGSVMRSGEVVKGSATRTFLETIAASLDEYENQMGDYPPSSIPSKLDPKPSKTNMGVEMLVISLWPADGKFSAGEVREERLCNVDGDNTNHSLTSYTSAECFELADDWGNPVAYIHRRDYGKRFTYLSFDLDVGEVTDQTVQARKSFKTGDYYNRSKFQLISAGEDGVFGNRDDIANFQLEDEEEE